MAYENKIVKITSTIGDATIRASNFGTVAICARLPSTLVKRIYGPFTDPDTLLAAPYSLPATHKAYIDAQRLMGQKPSPAEFKLGNLVSDRDRVVKFTPKAVPVEGDEFSINYNDTDYAYTAGVTPNVASVCAGLDGVLAPINAGGVSVADNGTDVTITQTAADIRANGPFRIKGVSLDHDGVTVNLDIEDTSPATNLAVDLADIKAADDASATPGMYGVTIDGAGEAEHEAAAGWANAANVFYFGTTQDTKTLDGSSTDDALYNLGQTPRNYAYTQYHEDAIADSPEAGVLGAFFGTNPGSRMLFGKQIQGVRQLTLKESTIDVIKAKKGNVIATVGGRSWLFEGWATSGRYVDVTRFMDWFDATLNAALLTYIASQEQIGQTDVDTQGLQAPFNEVVAIGESYGGLVPGSAKMTIPKVATMSQANKNARHAAGIKVNYTYKNKFQTFEIDLTVALP